MDSVLLIKIDITLSGKKGNFTTCLFPSIGLLIIGGVWF